MPKFDNSGRLSRNEDKAKEGANPNWPDYKGKITVAGTEYWLSGWIKKSESGSFISLSVKPKEGKPARKLPGGFEQMDDSIPFANPYRGRVCYVV